MSDRRIAASVALAVALCLPRFCGADEIPDRFGLLSPIGERLEAGLTLVWQTADGAGAVDELLGSFDALIRQPWAAGSLFLYLEGGATPDADGVSQRFPDANGDAGSALNADGEGRIQVSELFYQQPTQRGLLSVGLIDPTASLDQSEIANDETRQFLAPPLVNNPTIGFPDYTLGGYYHEDGRQFTLVMTSSHGLADNPDASYQKLFQINDEGKGVFLAAERYHIGVDLSWRFGAWLNSASYPWLSDTSKQDSNYGAYLVLEGPFQGYRWAGRFGLANPRVSMAAWFASLAAEWALPRGHAGLGYAYTGISDELPVASSDRRLFEAYLRRRLMPGVAWGPSLQYHARSQELDRERPAGWVGSLRLTLVF